MNKYLIIPDLKEIEEYLKIASEYDFGFEFNDFYSPKVLSDKKLCDEIIEKYSKHNLPSYLTFHGDFFDVLVFSADEEIVKISIKRIEESMKVAKKIGAKKVVFHTNYNSQIKTDFYLNNWLDKNYEVFSALCDKYKDITILMENMFDYDYVPLKKLAERMKDIDNFGVCLDYAHAFLSKVESKEWVLNLYPYIKHVHINDNDGTADSHLALGEGNIDWIEFNKLRKDYFNDSTILIEVNGTDKINKSLDYMKKHSFYD